MGHIVNEVVWYVYDTARLHQACDWRGGSPVGGSVGEYHQVWPDPCHVAE